MELPEVEMIRRDLEKEVVGKRIKEVDVRPQRNAMRVIRRHARRKEFSDLLVGGKITKVDRRGKYILLYLDSGNVLVIHFGMSGQLLRSTKRQTAPPHTHVDIEFAQGGNLRYVDPRTFGEMFVTAGRRARQGPRARPHRHRPARGHVHLAAVLLRARAARGQAEGAPDGPGVHLRARQHLLGRGAVRGRPALRPDVGHAVLPGGPPPVPGHARDRAGCDPVPGDHPRGRGVRGPVRQAGRVPERAQGLRAQGPGRAGGAAPRSTVKINGRTSYYCPQCQS